MPSKAPRDRGLDDEYFNELERRHEIALSARDRAQIKLVLPIYDRQKAASDERPNVAALGTALGKVTSLMEKIKREQPYIWRTITRSPTRNYDDILDHSKVLQARCIKYKGGHCRPDLDRRRSLQILELIFKRAGGGATGISRGDKEERHGRFLNFAYDVLSQSERGSRTKQALGAEWERIYSSRARQPRSSFMLGAETHWRVVKPSGDK